MQLVRQASEQSCGLLRRQTGLLRPPKRAAHLRRQPVAQYALHKQAHCADVDPAAEGLAIGGDAPLLQRCPPLLSLGAHARQVSFAAALPLCVNLHILHLQRQVGRSGAGVGE